MNKTAAKAFSTFFTVYSIDLSFFTDRMVLNHNIKLLKRYRKDGYGVVFACCQYLDDPIKCSLTRNKKWDYIEKWDGLRTYNITNNNFYLYWI